MPITCHSSLISSCSAPRPCLAISCGSIRVGSPVVSPECLTLLMKLIYILRLVIPSCLPLGIRVSWLVSLVGVVLLRKPTIIRVLLLLGNGPVLSSPRSRVPSCSSILMAKFVLVVTVRLSFPCIRRLALAVANIMPFEVSRAAMLANLVLSVDPPSVVDPSAWLLMPIVCSRFV